MLHIKFCIITLVNVASFHLSPCIGFHWLPCCVVGGKRTLGLKRAETIEDCLPKFP